MSKTGFVLIIIILCAYILFQQYLLLSYEVLTAELSKTSDMWSDLAVWCFNK